HASKPTPSHVNQVVLPEDRVFCRSLPNSKKTIPLNSAIRVLNFQSRLVREVRKTSGQRDEICKVHLRSPIKVVTACDLPVDVHQGIYQLVRDWLSLKQLEWCRRPP